MSHLLQSALSIVVFLILPSISHVIEAFLGRSPALPQEVSFVVPDTPTQLQSAVHSFQM